MCQHALSDLLLLQYYQLFCVFLVFITDICWKVPFGFLVSVTGVFLVLSTDRCTVDGSKEGSLNLNSCNIEE